MNEVYRAKVFLGELTLGDLWGMGLLEGMMILDEAERITAGLRGEMIEFCGPNGIARQYPSFTKVKLDTGHLPRWAVKFDGRTLVIARDMDSFLKEKNEENP